jgi:epoxide hydrolase-like predicted phosphatase
MVEAIIFDCFGVLTTDKWREFTATLPEGQHREARELNRAYGAGFIDKAEFRQAIRRLTGKLPEDIDTMLDNETAKNTGLLGYIARLKETYKIGLLSNVASNWIREQFLTPDEQGLFDDVIFSYEVGMTKPDPRIFALAAKRLGVEPAACILVDDVDSTCDSARQFGMQAVLYQNFPQAKADIQKLLV